MFILGNAAVAQTVEFSELERCAALGTDAAKLACFEALVAAHAEVPSRPTKAPAAASAEPEAPEEVPPIQEPAPVQADAGPVAQGAVPPASSPEPADVPPVSAAAAPETLAAEPVAATTPEPAPATAPQPATTSTPVPESTAAPAATPAPANTAAAIPDSYGRNERSGPEVVHASVVKVTKDRYGALIFHFENGQVWKQLEKRYFSYPKRREFDVTISQGMMGEYRLQVEGAGRRVTIRRMQ